MVRQPKKPHQLQLRMLLLGQLQLTTSLTAPRAWKRVSVAATLTERQTRLVTSRMLHQPTTRMAQWAAQAPLCTAHIERAPCYQGRWHTAVVALVHRDCPLRCTHRQVPTIATRVAVVVTTPTASHLRRERCFRECMTSSNATRFSKTATPICAPSSTKKLR